MGTQLLFYETAVQVSSEKHRDWSIKKGTDYTFAQHVNAVPLTGVEFSKAAAEYAIVFTGTAEAVMPAVILGVQKKQNLYLNPDGTWQAKYVPSCHSVPWRTDLRIFTGDDSTPCDRHAEGVFCRRFG